MKQRPAATVDAVKSPLYGAFDLAADLGHRYTGAEHVLAAWVATEQREAFDVLGLTADRLRDALAARGNDREQDWSTSAPGFHVVRGRAQGLALAGGRATVSLADVGRACLWDAEGPVHDLLEQLGVSQDDVVHAVGDMPARADAGPLLHAAEAEASALGHGFLGDLHVVLALLGGQPDRVAEEVLSACGISRRGCAEWFAAFIDSCDPPPSPAIEGAVPRPSPACRELLARAEGLAGARMRPVVSTDALVAWLWEDDGEAVCELEALGTTGPAVVDALVARGVELPVVPLPEPDRRPWGETVYFPLDRLGDVLHRLNADLTPGEWGWNRTGDHAWVDGLATIDIQAIVDDVLGDVSPS